MEAADPTTFQIWSQIVIPTASTIATLGLGAAAFAVSRASFRFTKQTKTESDLRREEDAERESLRERLNFVSRALDWVIRVRDEGTVGRAKDPVTTLYQEGSTLEFEMVDQFDIQTGEPNPMHDILASFSRGAEGGGAPIEYQALVAQARLRSWARFPEHYEKIRRDWDDFERKGPQGDSDDV